MAKSATVLNPFKDIELDRVRACAGEEGRVWQQRPAAEAVEPEEPDFFHRLSVSYMSHIHYLRT